MISYIKGCAADITENSLIIETYGIGYNIYMPDTSLSAIIKGDEIKIFTYMNVKEDGISLYGFKTREELNMFNLLISVTGVGPKAGLMLLSALTPSQISLAVLTNDTNALTKAQGIGKKMAARIVLELTDKLKTADAITPQLAGAQQSIDYISASGAKQDAAEALITLGFSRSEVLKAVTEIPDADMPAEQIIKAALKKLSR